MREPEIVPLSQVAALLQRAVLHLRRDEAADAEIVLMRLLGVYPDEFNALHLLGCLRCQQKRLHEATALFRRSLDLRPEQPYVQLNLGHVLRTQSKFDEAATAFRAAVKLKPDLEEAHLFLGNTLFDSGKQFEAEESYRRLLQLFPGNVPAKVRLGAILINDQRAAEAEIVLRRGLTEATNPKMIADLEVNLGLALSLQQRPEEAFACYERARAADPERAHLDYRRAHLLQDMGRFDEALATFRRLLVREPLNFMAHLDYNQLLYCMNRNDEFLRSYDEAAMKAPHEIRLLTAKAAFLLQTSHAEEAQEIYQRILASDPGNLEAVTGAAVALADMKQFIPAVHAFETAISRYPKQTGLYSNLAGTFVQMREPEKAEAIAMRGLATDPYDQLCLALLGTSYRMMKDKRESRLNLYNDLIRVFDLEPPEGYSDMMNFNRDLDAYLDRLHTRQREYIDQSLRNGTQTPNNIFGAGHELIERLRVRIIDAVTRYLTDMEVTYKSEYHPFLSRRSPGFVFTGSWSSRLRDNGFHINHIHPKGWISSCYYVSLPSVVDNVESKQGWIKFGEPPYDVGLAEPVARAIQPAPGRLVLFPSYIWHGTVPFRSATCRTTIAFDAVPT